MDACASITIIFPNRLLCQLVYNVLLPETRTPPSERRVASVDVKGNLLLLFIRADSIAGLRALLNAYIRWIHLASQIALEFSREDEDNG
ncbi:MAG TPA: hypothetical protein ENF82_02645 [Candidatus Methanomethylia archaeon]|nr:hypothetical protein [Candidatus Methanomethylicia archaeon]